MVGYWIVVFASGFCADMVGGACVDAWHTSAMEWTIYILVVTGLILIPVLAAWVAPAGRRWVAGVCGLVSTLPFLALYFSTGLFELTLPAVLAVVAAVVGIGLVWRTSANPHSNTGR